MIESHDGVLYGNFKKTKKLWSNVTMWMNLSKSEQKSYRRIQTSKSIDRKQICGCQGREERGMGRKYFIDMGFSYGVMKTILKLKRDGGCTTL